MGYVFRYISTTRGHTPKRTPPSDSAIQIGPSTLSKNVLTVDEGSVDGCLKNGHIFRHISPTRASTSKQTTPFGSAHQIGLSTISKDVLTVDEGACGFRFKNREIGNVFTSDWRPSGDMAKRSVALDSAHRIGLSPVMVLSIVHYLPI